MISSFQDHVGNHPLPITGVQYNVKDWKTWLQIPYLMFRFPRLNAAQNNAVAITARAMLCFDNTTVRTIPENLPAKTTSGELALEHIYKNCQGQYRLTANGTLSVPKNATNFFCNGPCMAETQLVLGCIDGILSNFQFYNGATVQAVNATLLLACGNTTKRGDFNVSKNVIAAPAGHGSGLHSSDVLIPDVGNLADTSRKPVERAHEIDVSSTGCA
ncbi:hypothetical protein Taro_036326 [Colocasia esculenta]|uniref:DUF7731 domain-containing protein n=1 Tax=Colocasia esculenta TaxID=4460 RepID=A0A843WLC5_COLES|nr:hypothetical protein [Colocasia esculenta]